MREREGNRRSLDADNTAAYGDSIMPFDSAAAGDFAELAAERHRRILRERRCGEGKSPLGMGVEDGALYAG